MTANSAEAVQPDEAILQRIRSEYCEMPGLSLTTSQAQRLWSLRREECEALLEELVIHRFLRQTHGGAFIKD
jgi:hypothetical protein